MFPLRLVSLVAVVIASVLATVLAGNGDNGTMMTTEETVTDGSQMIQQPRSNYATTVADISRVGNALTSFSNIVIGVASILFNIVNIIVMSRQKTVSPFIYLNSLAVCDLLTGVLMTCNGILLNHNFLRQSQTTRVVSYWTQIPAYFLRSWLSSSATYLVNALSLDRMIAICYPMKRAVWCTQKRARIASAVLILCGVIPNFHIVLRLKSRWYPDPSSGHNIPVAVYTDIGRDPIVTDVTSYGRLILKQVVPLTLLIFTSIRTMNDIIKSLRFRNQNSKNTRKDVPCLGMTMGVISVFVFTNIPLVVYSLNISINGPYRNASFAMAMFLKVIEIFPWINSFSNFFVYIITNNKFRKDMIGLFLCKKAEENKSGVNSRSSVTKQTSLNLNP